MQNINLTIISFGLLRQFRFVNIILSFRHDGWITISQAMYKTTTISQTTKMAAPANTENSSPPRYASLCSSANYVTMERQKYFNLTISYGNIVRFES